MWNNREQIVNSVSVGTGPKSLYNNMNYSWKFVSKITIVYHCDNVLFILKILNTGKTKQEINT